MAEPCPNPNKDEKPASRSSEIAKWLSDALIALTQRTSAATPQNAGRRVKAGCVVGIALACLLTTIMGVWFRAEIVRGVTAAATQILKARQAVEQTYASYPRFALAIVVLSLAVLCLTSLLIAVCFFASRKFKPYVQSRGAVPGSSTPVAGSLTTWQRRLEKFTRRWPALAAGSVFALLLVTCFWFASQFQNDLVPFAAAIIVCGVGILVIKKIWEWLTGLGLADVIKNDVPTVVHPATLRWTRDLPASAQAHVDQSIRDICSILADAYSAASQARLIRVVLGSVLAVGGAFLVYVQIQKLTEQNRLFETQNAIGVSTSHFEMDLALGKDHYDDLSKQLGDQDVTDLTLAAALRRAADIAVRPVRILARDEHSVMAKFPLRLDYRYPNYDPVRSLLRTFIQSNRLGRQTATAEERRLRAEATTELLIALHETQLEPLGTGQEVDESLKEQLLGGKLSQELRQRLDKLSSSEAVTRDGLSMNRPPPDWKSLLSDVFKPPGMLVLAGWPSDLFYKAPLPFAFRLTKEKPVVILPPNCEAQEADFSQWNAILLAIPGDGGTMADFQETIFECADVGLAQIGPGSIDLQRSRFGCAREVALTSLAGATISNASFESATLLSTALATSFEGSKFVGAEIRGRFLSCNFTKASLVGTKIWDGKFWDCRFDNAELAGAEFALSQAKACNFSRANFAPTVVRVKERQANVVGLRGEPEAQRIWYELSKDADGIEIDVPGAVLYLDVEGQMATIRTEPEFVRKALSAINEKGIEALPEYDTSAIDSREFIDWWVQLMNNRPERGFGLDRLNGVRLALTKSMSETGLFKSAPRGGMPTGKTGYTLEQSEFDGAIFANKRGACYMPAPVRDAIRKNLDESLARIEEEKKKGPENQDLDEWVPDEMFRERLRARLALVKETRGQLDRVITDEAVIEKRMKWNIHDAVREAKTKLRRSR